MKRSYYVNVKMWICTILCVEQRNEEKKICAILKQRGMRKSLHIHAIEILIACDVCLLKETTEGEKVVEAAELSKSYAVYLLSFLFVCLFEMRRLKAYKRWMRRLSERQRLSDAETELYACTMYMHDDAKCEWVSGWVYVCVSCKRRHQPWIKSFDIERYTLGICIRCASSLSSNWFPDSGRCIDRMRWTNCQCMGFVMYEDDNAEYVNEIFNGMNENCMWISSQRILSTILDSPFAFSHRKMSMSSHFGIHHFV